MSNDDKMWTKDALPLVAAEPTMRLRFIERVVPIRSAGGNDGQLVRVLQQQFRVTTDATPRFEWRDVPLESQP